MNFFTIKKRIIFVLLLLIGTISGSVLDNARAEAADHVLISEVQIYGENASDEFIELYNPTNVVIDLKDWDLKKITKTGSVENIVMNVEGTIPASGYFLIVPRANCGETKTESCYKGAVEKDAEYTTNNYLAKDNAIALYDQSGNLIDKVGWGAAADFEGEVFQNNPENGQSLERVLAENVMQDTDNNRNDFVLQAAPSPMNTKSVLQNTDGQTNGNESDQTEGQGPGGSNQNNETQNSGAQGGPTFSSGSSAQNQTAKIIITEFLPNPEDSDSDNEFIEIYNAGLRDENIGGWVMEDKIGKVKSYSIPGNTVLKAGEYKAFMSSETRIVLNNSGDGIVLKNMNGGIQDETPTSGAAGEDVSYALKEDGLWVWTKKPTPGAKNIIEADEKYSEAKAGSSKTEQENTSEEAINYDYSDGIIITEILPDPEGSDNKLNYEWIEVYNGSGNDINLKGWKIDDILNKGSKPYVFKEDKKIKPAEYLVFSNEETKIILNNTEDEVNIVWPDGTVVDTVSYKKPKEGFSYALLDGGRWDWSSKPSPGKENVLAKESESTGKRPQETISEDYVGGSEEALASQEEDAEYFPQVKATEFIETDVESAKKLPRFSAVKISGIVSVSPGIFQENMFYISGSGIQVFSYSKIFGGIALGDKIELFGKMSEVGGEKRLLVESPDYIKIIGHDNLLEPKLISTGEVGEKYEGYLVLIEGNMISENSEVFYVDDGSGRAKIYIKPETRIKKSEMKSGDPVNVTGIVSRTSLGYRVLPRFQNDIRIGKTSSVSSSPEGQVKDVSSAQNNGKNNNGIPFYYYGFMLAALVVLIDWGRMKTKK